MFTLKKIAIGWATLSTDDDAECFSLSLLCGDRCRGHGRGAAHDLPGACASVGLGDPVLRGDRHGAGCGQHGEGDAGRA